MQFIYSRHEKTKMSAEIKITPSELIYIQGTSKPPVHVHKY